MLLLFPKAFSSVVPGYEGWCVPINKETGFRNAVKLLPGVYWIYGPEFQGLTRENLKTTFPAESARSYTIGSW